MKNIFLFICCLFLFTSNVSAEKLSAKVEKINDGDTIVVTINSEKEHVRLIGIDAPESYENQKALHDAEVRHQDLETILKLGKLSSAFMRKTVHVGDEVQLETDVERRDKYHRLLAYVFLPDGTMLNEKILSEGFARLYTFPPNVKYISDLKAAYQEARENHRGLWRVD